ncbi:BEN domain-containing protein 7 [Trichomycterus rosablanca]|uniref:BEN domain-containing protein 7 n=1 Tax=Trichomycterus rosablanca TaxID=2290929 RepID=UPI002F3561C6
MELAERRRSRKSQSFKLISETDYRHESESVEHFGTDSKSLDISENETWLGEEGMEIKRQITGMMRLLSDKAGRVYQRVGSEGETLKEEPQEEEMSWDFTQNRSPEDPEHCWNSANNSQYDTRSKTQKLLDHTKNRDSSLPNVPASMTAEPSCCMCNCKSTLQAILLELRTMRKLMQTQQEPPEKQCSVGNPSSTCRKRSRKRRAVHRVSVLTLPRKPTASPQTNVTHGLKQICQEEQERIEMKERERKDRVQSSSSSIPFCNSTPSSHYSLNRVQNCTELEVQLAEDYEVFIPKAQLDSILLNYTRSGSLLFRKLVCAFFDDATLANSLPNGKRKRGLNDNRKGLDQNIVGAIKVFTEKYCTANRIEKLPGPRDWVQILQDQIKLARRRLKRAETTTDCDEINRTWLDKTGADCVQAECVAVENL